MKVFIVDDHPLFIAGIRTLLSDEADFSIIGEAQNGQEAIEEIQQQPPDIVIMDISMPQMDGIETTRKLLADYKDIKVIALSIHMGKRYVKEMLDAGAVGYLVKDSAPEELVSALKKIAAGEMYLSSTITSIALSPDDDTGQPILAKDSLILRTKLHRPPLSEDLVKRTEIIQQMEKNRSRPLTLVSAGAGYGKSIAVSQWLENADFLHSWLSLDEEHNDLRIFLSYLVAIIENIAPDMVNETRSFLQAPELPPLPLISQTLINELDAIEQEFILVFDDYHRIEQEQIHELLNELLRFPPENMQLVLLTRRDPPLNLTNLRAHGRLNEIRINQLRFNEEETNALFQKLYQIPLDTTVIGMLVKKTEGWVVGMRLAALLVSASEDVKQLLSTMKGDSRLIADFLVEEVLIKQPPQIQDYLLRTSILNRFCEELIEDVNPVKDPDQRKKISGSEFIQWLVKFNLFVVPLDGQGNWFRYHHLFQDLLNNQLNQQKNNDEIAELHAKASQWYEDHEFIEEAIHHALKSGNPNSAAEILERKRSIELDRDRWYILGRWLNMLPPEIQEKHPRLLFIRAWICYERSQTDELVSLLEQLEKFMAIETVKDELVGEMDFFKGYFSYFQGQGELSRKYLEEALEKVQDGSSYIRGEVELMLGIALQMCGQQEVAIQTLNKNLSEADPSNNLYLTRLFGGLAFIYLLAGELTRAQESLNKMERLAIKQDTPHTLGWNSYLSALVFLHSFTLVQASSRFRSAVDKRYTGHSRVSTDALAGLALVYQITGNRKAADETMSTLQEFARETNDPECLTVASSSQARLALLQGELTPALQWARSFEGQPEPSNLFFWLESPPITQARVLIFAGKKEDLNQALESLGSLRKQVETLNFSCQLIEILILQVVALEKLDRTTDALAVLEEVVLMAQHGGWIRPFIEAGSIMANLLKQLLERDIARNYIEKLLEVFEEYETAKSRKPVTMPAGKPATQPEKIAIGEFEVLTHREREVLTHLSKGYRNKEIASELYLSIETVKRHLYNIFQKLHVHSRVQAIAKSRELGLLLEK